MPITINGSGSITTHSTGPDFYLDRVDSSIEGGQITFRRASDNADMYGIDVNGSGSTPNFRIFNTQASSLLLSMGSTGDLTLTSNNLTLGTRSIAANGYTRLPNGLILQWGVTGNIGQDSSGSVTFPIAFPSAVYCITITGRQGINTTSGGSDTISTQSTTGFTIAHGADGTSTFYWMAIGV